MGFKRSQQRMAEVEVKLRAGMARNGIVGETADEIVRSITSFALYGFPESHAASFALLAYASAYLKAHHPAVFVCALLNNQPMGFYHPFTLVKDAQRHGARFRPVDVTRSEWLCTLEDGAVRLGLRYVRGLREAAARRCAAERGCRPFASLQDFVDRAALHDDELKTAGRGRRAERLRPHAPQRAVAGGARGTAARTALQASARTRADASPLPEMDLGERLASDLSGTGITVGPHPLRLYREVLRGRGILRAADLAGLSDGARVRVAGAVICRQRPGTAKGFVFLTLEDETGLVNVIVRPDQFDRDHTVLVSTHVLEIDGILQAQDGLSVRALAVRPAPVGQVPVESRDFH